MRNGEIKDIEYLEEIEEVDPDDFDKAEDALKVAKGKFFRRNLYAMMNNAEPDMLKKAAIYGVYGTEDGTYLSQAVQWARRYKENLELGDIAQIKFGCDIFSTASPFLARILKRYYNIEESKLPEKFKETFKEFISNL